MFIRQPRLPPPRHKEEGSWRQEVDEGAPETVFKSNSGLENSFGFMKMMTLCRRNRKQTKCKVCVSFFLHPIRVLGKAFTLKELRARFWYSNFTHATTLGRFNEKEQQRVAHMGVFYAIFFHYGAQKCTYP